MGLRACPPPPGHPGWAEAAVQALRVSLAVCPLPPQLRAPHLRWASPTASRRQRQLWSLLSPPRGPARGPAEVSTVGTEQLLPEGPWAPGSAPVGPQGLLKFLEPTQQGPPPTKQDAPTSTPGPGPGGVKPMGHPQAPACDPAGPTGRVSLGTETEASSPVLLEPGGLWLPGPQPPLEPEGGWGAGARYLGSSSSSSRPPTPSAAEDPPLANGPCFHACRGAGPCPVCEQLKSLPLLVIRPLLP